MPWHWPRFVPISSLGHKPRALSNQCRGAWGGLCVPSEINVIMFHLNQVGPICNQHPSLNSHLNLHPRPREIETCFNPLYEGALKLISKYRFLFNGESIWVDDDRELPPSEDNEFPRGQFRLHCSAIACIWISICCRLQRELYYLYILVLNANDMFTSE